MTIARTFSLKRLFLVGIILPPPHSICAHRCSVIQVASYDVDESGNIFCSNCDNSGRLVVCEGKKFIKWNLVNSGVKIPNASAVTFRRDIALKISKEYLTFKSAGDTMFWINMLEKGDYGKLELPLNYFRHHRGEVTTQRGADGTLGKESFRIHTYLKKQGYIKGIVAIDEFRIFWNIFHTASYNSEEIRKELIHLWFPWWKRTKLYRFYVNVYYFLYGKAYTVYKKMRH